MMSCARTCLRQVPALDIIDEDGVSLQIPVHLNMYENTPLGCARDGRARHLSDRLYTIYRVQDIGNRAYVWETDDRAVGNERMRAPAVHIVPAVSILWEQPLISMLNCSKKNIVRP